MDTTEDSIEPEHQAWVTTLRRLREDYDFSQAEQLISASSGDSPISDVELARLRIAQHNEDDALAILTDVVERYPNYPAGVAWRIAVLDRVGRLDEALATATEGLKCFARSEKLLVAAARLHLRLGNYDEALALFEGILNDRIASADVYRWYAEVLLTLGRRDEAVQVAKDAVARLGNDPEALVFAGDILIQADVRHTVEGLDCIQRAMRLQPDHSAAYTSLCQALRHMRRWADAEAAAREAIERRPRVPDLCVELGWALVGLGRDEDALAAYVSALDIDPRHEWALRSRVDLLRALRRWADAEAAARELIQAHEREPRSYVNLGWVFADQDRDEEALAAYMSALDIDPNDPTALEWRIAALRALRRWADAEAAARDAIERRPRVPDLHVELGRLYEERNRFEMALGQAEEALRRDPWSWSAHDQRCRSLLALLRFSDAEDDARDYVAARPSAVRPRCLLARVLDAQHRYAEAVAEYEQALSLDSTDVDAVIGMSATLRSIRCFGEAESLIIRAIDRHPNNMDLPAELAFLYRDRGDRQQADVSFELLLERATGPIESAKALYGRGWVAISDHRHADATRYFTDAVALNPHDSQTRISLAWSYLRSGESNDVIESERLCREILVEGWRNHLVHTCLGMLAYRRKEYAAAERHFRRSVELAPFDGCLTDLGALLAHLGRYDKAESFLRRALTLDAWDTQARIELGNMYLQRSEARAESDADRIDAHRALSEFRQALNSDPNSGSAALGLAVATVHSTGDLTSAEETLATALRRDVRDQPKWQLHLALARLLIQAGDADQQAEFYDRAVQQAMSAIRLASHQAEPYFVAGQAEQRLGSNANDPLLRTLHRRRAYTYFKKCRENDNDHAGATHAMRILEMEKVTSRSSSISRLALFGLSSSILVVMWTDFIWGDNVTEAMLMTLTPILIGFMVIGLLLPLLVRLKLPGGMEANLTASIDQISTGPTGHINVTAPRFPSIGGPMGQIPRLGLQHT